MSTDVRFLTPLRVEKLHSGRWRVYEDFCFLIDEEMMCVEKGFETDFASVPRLPFAYLLAGNTSHEAAVIHDWLYRNGFKREWADGVFLKALEVEGVASWRRYLMWAAVRVGGSFAYYKHKMRKATP